MPAPTKQITKKRPPSPALPRALHDAYANAARSRLLDLYPEDDLAAPLLLRDEFMLEPNNWAAKKPDPE